MAAMEMRNSLKITGGPYGSRTRLSRLKKLRIFSNSNALGTCEVEIRLKAIQWVARALPNTSANSVCPSKAPAPPLLRDWALPSSSSMLHPAAVSRYTGRGRPGLPISHSSGARSQPPRSAAALYVL